MNRQPTALSGAALLALAVLIGTAAAAHANPATEPSGPMEVRQLREVVPINAYDFPVTENLDVAARALGVYTIKPGARFSLNAALGRRTPAKGYRPARSYAATGSDIEEVGGGLCMLSTVLYRLFAGAGLAIEERFPHLRVVSYAPAGLDAAINFPTKDLRVRNTTGHPIRFRVYRSGRVLTAEMVGRFPRDLEIRLDRRVAPAVIPGRVENGFRVRTIRTTLRDGLPVRSEVLSLDVFGAIDRLEEKDSAASE